MHHCGQSTGKEIYDKITRARSSTEVFHNETCSILVALKSMHIGRHALLVQYKYIDIYYMISSYHH